MAFLHADWYVCVCAGSNGDQTTARPECEHDPKHWVKAGVNLGKSNQIQLGTEKLGV